MLPLVRGPGVTFVVWAIGDAISRGESGLARLLPIPRIAVLVRHTRHADQSFCA
jgi:hypothetical protein